MKTITIALMAVCLCAAPVCAGINIDITGSLGFHGLGALADSLRISSIGAGYQLDAGLIYSHDASRFMGGVGVTLFDKNFTVHGDVDNSISALGAYGQLSYLLNPGRVEAGARVGFVGITHDLETDIAQFEASDTRIYAEPFIRATEHFPGSLSFHLDVAYRIMRSGVLTTDDGEATAVRYNLNGPRVGCGIGIAIGTGTR